MTERSQEAQAMADEQGAQTTDETAMEQLILDIQRHEGNVSMLFYGQFNRDLAAPNRGRYHIEINEACPLDDPGYCQGCGHKTDDCFMSFCGHGDTLADAFADAARQWAERKAAVQS